MTSIDQSEISITRNIMLELGIPSQEGQVRLSSGGCREVRTNRGRNMVCNDMMITKDTPYTLFLCSCVFEMTLIVLAIETIE